MNCISKAFMAPHYHSPEAFPSAFPICNSQDHRIIEQKQNKNPTVSSGTSVITAGSHPDVPGAVQMCSALSKALELLTALLLLGFTAIRRHFFSIQGATFPRLGQPCFAQSQVSQHLNNLYYRYFPPFSFIFPCFFFLFIHIVSIFHTLVLFLLFTHAQIKSQGKSLYLSWSILRFFKWVYFLI